MKTRKVNVVLIFILLLQAISAAAMAFTVSEAESLLSSFTSAVIARDSAAVTDCWSRRSVDRAGFFQSLHGTIGNIVTLCEFASFLDRHTFSVTGIDRTNDYYFILNFAWLSLDPAGQVTAEAAIPMHYYVVLEDNRYVFINPIDAITFRWNEEKYGNIRFHYPQQPSGPERPVYMNRMAALCRSVLARQADYFIDPGEVDMYVARDGAEVGELLLHPPAGGYAVAERNLIVSPTFINPHEFIHLASTFNGIFINTAFAEGLAVGLGGTYWSTPAFSLAAARELRRDSRYVGLTDLLFSGDKAFLDSAQITYHEAGALIHFLIETYGMDRLIELYRRNTANEDLKNIFENLYQEDTDQIEARWHRYLAELPSPEITYTIPESATLLFALDDRQGDDNGNGLYTYPTEPGFRPGSLDLTRFEVHTDRGRVYFRINFDRLGRSVTDSATGHTYTPGIMIAINRGPEHGAFKLNHCFGLVFGEDGYDIRIDIGRSLIVWNQYNRAVHVTGSIRDSLSRGHNNCLEFSLPTSFLGEAGPDWRYFVGTTLFDDYGFGFLRFFPVPVRRRNGPFNFGGLSGDERSPFIDILLPEYAGQKKYFTGELDRLGRLLAVPMVGPRNIDGLK